MSRYFSILLQKLMIPGFLWLLLLRSQEPLQRRPYSFVSNVVMIEARTRTVERRRQPLQQRWTLKSLQVVHCLNCDSDSCLICWKYWAKQGYWITSRNCWVTVRHLSIWRRFGLAGNNFTFASNNGGPYKIKVKIFLFSARSR